MLPAYFSVFCEKQKTCGGVRCTRGSFNARLVHLSAGKVHVSPFCGAEKSARDFIFLIMCQERRTGLLQIIMKTVCLFVVWPAAAWNFVLAARSGPADFPRGCGRRPIRRLRLPTSQLNPIYRLL